MSGFFLDTELNESDLRLVADRIREAEYSIHDAKRILLDELFPALLFNLHDVAGEWAGFEDEWLFERIEKTKNPSLIKRIYHRMNYWMVKDYWNKLEQIMESEQ